jgi:hypothetical protein
MQDKPAVNADAVVPSDTTSNTFRALYVGTGGDIVILALDDSTSVTFKNVPGGSILPVSTSRVYATGTTATDIVGLL